MPTTAANRSRQAAFQHFQATIAACIVDPQADEYQSVCQAAAAHGVELHIVATAHEALRLARGCKISHWVVNTDLAGISGYELCGMLKAQSSRAAVCLLANEYSVTAEHSAWRARATMFLCRGNHAELLSDWLTSGPSPAPAT